MPEGVRWSTPGGGPTVWLEVPRDVGVSILRQKLAERGVLIEDTAAHFQGEPHLHGFRVGYAFLSQDLLRRGLERVADTIDELSRRPPA